MTGSRRTAAAAFAAAIFLAVPATVHAQARARAKTLPPASAPTSTRAAPAPVAPPPTAAPPAPLEAPPAPAEPSAFAAPLEEDGPWRVAAVVGYEKDSDSDLAGPRLQLEAKRDLVALGSRGQLSFVAAAGWFHGTDSVTVSLAGVTATTDVTADVYELVPSFRFGFALVPRLRFFADVGVGGGWTQGTSETVALGVASTTKSDSFLGVLRLSAGATFALNERLRIGVELPTLVRRYGEAQSQTLSFSAMAAYAF